MQPSIPQPLFDSILYSGYTVRLDAFEGPLDLLLHLIRKNEVEITDIPIATITRQYMEYLELMKELREKLGLPEVKLLSAGHFAHISRDWTFAMQHADERIHAAG